MKIARFRTLTVIAAAALLSGFAATGHAVTHFTDTFTYPNGNLVGQGGWAAHSGAAAKPIQVAAGAVIVQQSAGSGEDINRGFPTQAATSVTYASFTLKVNGTVGSANDYFAHFRPAGSDSNNFVARTYIGPPTAGGDYTLGIAAGSLTTTPLAPWGTGLTLGQTYRVVIAYDGNTGTSTLWVDPVDQNSTSVSSTSATLNSRLLASFAYRQASPAGATSTQTVDNLGVASTFAESIVSPNAVPSVSQWGLLILASLIVAGGFYAIRRRGASHA